MNKIRVYDDIFETDKYVHRFTNGYTRSPFVGEKINPRKIIFGVYDNEKELAYALFSKEYYKMNHFSSRELNPAELYRPDGSKMNENDVTNLIEKYFPEETTTIKKRLSNGSKLGFKQLVNWKIIDFWLITQKKIIDNFSEETKLFIKEINDKSDHYINTLFIKHQENNIKNKRIKI